MDQHLENPLWARRPLDAGLKRQFAEMREKARQSFHQTPPHLKPKEPAICSTDTIEAALEDLRQKVTPNGIQLLPVPANPALSPAKSSLKVVDNFGSATAFNLSGYRIPKKVVTEEEAEKLAEADRLARYRAMKHSKRKSGKKKRPRGRRGGKKVQEAREKRESFEKLKQQR